MRDRLLKILNEVFNTNFKGDYQSGISDMADKLLSKGVFVPPCKIGDTVYFIHQGCVLSGVVQSYENGHYVTAWVASCTLNFAILNISFGESAFLTREEAEKALAERSECEE